MGYCSLVPLLYHIIELEDVPYSLWLMVTGGAIIGARLGPFINALLGTLPIICFFAVILAIEICRYVTSYFLLPMSND